MQESPQALPFVQVLQHSPVSQAALASPFVTGEVKHTAKTPNIAMLRTKFIPAPTIVIHTTIAILPASREFGAD